MPGSRQAFRLLTFVLLLAVSGGSPVSAHDAAHDAAGDPANQATGEAAGAVIARAFDAAGLRDLQIGQAAVVRGVPVGGRPVDLELERFSVWTEDGVFVRDDRPAPRPDLVLLRGRVAGDPGSRVVLGIGAHATNGFIRAGTATHSISSGGLAEPDAVRISDLAELGVDAVAPGCGINAGNMDAFNPLGIDLLHDADQPPGTGGARGAPGPCREVRVAIDTDFEWTHERFGGNADAAAEYAVFLIAAVSEIYEREVNARLVVPYLRTFSQNIDPYAPLRNAAGELSPDPLDQVRVHWRETMPHIDRELVHLLTGMDTTYGGVAYLSTVCSRQWGYGVSGYLGGSFPYPLQDSHGGNWDLYVVAHEIGHNFGTAHTHDGYTPPIDNCGIDCSGNTHGTIMSYCHGCPGGMLNIDLRFHPLVQQQIQTFLAGLACDLEPEAGARDDAARTTIGVPVDVYALGNDRDADCGWPSIASAQSPTANGGTVSIESTGANPINDPTFLRYTPPTGFTGTDTFGYTTTDGATAAVTVEVLPLIPSVSSDGPLGGLAVAYYDIAPTGTMPGFGALTPFATGIAPSIEFPLSDGNAAGSPRTDNVAAVFTGWIRIPADGLFTFETISDEGSLLYVADRLVVDNDGLHEYRADRGSIALEQGDHRVRLEYFEASGAAGLSLRMYGPGGASGLIPSAFLIAGDAPAPCVADLNHDGIVDLSDISRFILNFQFHVPSADLAPPAGVFDLADITAFVTAFALGCP